MNRREFLKISCSELIMFRIDYFVFKRLWA